MGVYIPNYEMPERCTMCRMCGAQFCMLTANRILDFTKRNEDCPLVEVKSTHGRLGDLDALAMKWKFDNLKKREIQESPTIIEAEGEK